MNIIRKYWDSVYIYVLLLMPGFCACAGTWWTVCKLLGWYQHLEWVQLLTFDFTQIIYFLVAIIFISKNRQDHSYIPEHLALVKSFIVIALFIQYNFIMYLFPSVHVWECTFLFFTTIVFLFDSKLTLLNMIAYFIALLIAHIVRPEAFLSLYESNVAETIAWRIMIFCLTSFCILVIVYFVERFLMQAQESSEENVHLMEKQLKYYKDMELMDVELRKFRHDIKNHFMCMEYLYRNEKKEELDQYFHDLQDAFLFQEKIYATGNVVIDAILNHDLHSMCNDNVKITVYGNLPEIKSVAAMDLCTVFSNMLSNAIASANKAEVEDAQMVIRFFGGERFFSMVVSNSFTELEDEKKKKKDRNHGHGLYNIRNTVDKYNGNFEQLIDGDMIMTTVYLPI